MIKQCSSLKNRRYVIIMTGIYSLSHCTRTFYNFKDVLPGLIRLISHLVHVKGKRVHFRKPDNIKI